MSVPFPRLAVVRTGATMTGFILVAAVIFLTIRYFKRQSDELDKLEGERVESARASHQEEPYLQREPRDASFAQKEEGRKAVIKAEKAVEIAKQKEQTYEKIYTEFKDAGMVRSSSLPTLNSIVERKAILARLEDANLALDGALKAVRENEILAYRKRATTYPHAPSAETSPAQDPELEKLIVIRACDRELIGQFKQILHLLETDWGAWKADAAEIVLFDNTAEANRYNALRRQIVETSNHQHALQTEAVQKAPTQPVSTPRITPRFNAQFIGPPADGEIPSQRSGR